VPFCRCADDREAEPGAVAVRPPAPEPFERAGSLVWITVTDDRLLKINYEAPEWLAEAGRRKTGGKTQ